MDLMFFLYLGRIVVGSIVNAERNTLNRTTAKSKSSEAS